MKIENILLVSSTFNILQESAMIMNWWMVTLRGCTLGIVYIDGIQQLVFIQNDYDAIQRYQTMCSLDIKNTSMNAFVQRNIDFDWKLNTFLHHESEYLRHQDRL